jgi:6-pyruvoyltetrahydropterin/6-carboxytetrahydropterin synthase
MYTIAVKREFIAQHYLIGGDWGPENELHAHHYQVELQIEGDSLDDHGYMVDIVEIERALDTTADRYRNRTLNDLPEFEGLNPSIEHFARILCQSLAREVRAPNVRAVAVKIWENEIAWATYRKVLPGALAE